MPVPRWMYAAVLAILVMNRRRIRRLIIRQKYSKAEWDTRCQLAALYRLAERHSWDEVIYNHITARVPGEDAILINGFGLRYGEITASNLVKIDLEGNLLDAGSCGMERLNYPGLVIHTALHGARPDLHCVIHHHHPDVNTVASTKMGFQPLSQIASVLFDRVSPEVHAYEGIAAADEKGRIAAKLSNKQHHILLMANHGVLVCGRSIAEAYFQSVSFSGACRHQVNMMAATGGDIEKMTVVPPSVVADTTSRLKDAMSRMNAPPSGVLEFAAMRRSLPDDYTH